MTDPIQFALHEFTRILVTSINMRSELHGEAHVPAVDVFFRLTAANTMLDILSPPLRHQLYRPLTDGEEPDQLELDEVDAVTDTPLLRNLDLKMPVKLSKECVGWRLEFDFGRGGRSNLVLPGTKLDKFEVVAKQGGTVEIEFKCSASRVEPAAFSKLGPMIGLEQSIRLTAPTVGEAIDGTEGHPGALVEAQTEREPDATDTFVAAHTIEPQRTRTERGREQTAKALAAGAQS